MFNFTVISLDNFFSCLKYHEILTTFYEYQTYYISFLCCAVIGYVGFKYSQSKLFYKFWSKLFQKFWSKFFKPASTRTDSQVNFESEAQNNPVKRSMKMVWKILCPAIREIKSKTLKFLIFASIVTVIIGCVLNLLVPVYSQLIAGSLMDLTQTNQEKTEELLISVHNKIPIKFPWDLIVIYIIMKSFQGEGRLSFLFSIQNLIWIPIQQHVALCIQVNFFEHIHSLGLDWHAKIQTGEILGALDRGTEGIATILETLIFSFVPILADLTVAIIFLSTVFNPLFGFIIIFQVCLYIFVTLRFTRSKSNFQRNMNEADNLQRQKVVESLQNFEAVKYFTNENYESQKYKAAIQGQQKHQKIIEQNIYHLQILQIFILNSGLLFCSIICAWMIVHDRILSIGDYVLLTAYLTQLYGPIFYLGTYYRIIKFKLLELEQLYKILQTQPTIIEKPDALDLKMTQGIIKFENVSFGYDPKLLILKNISFSATHGQKTALVGLSGSGKTSILKLLLRLYEPNSGEIFIDDINIKEVSLKSLRKAIGIVPQDAALFADSFENQFFKQNWNKSTERIFYSRENIKYGNLCATLEKVKAAAKNAQIHSKIILLPEGFDTKLGERGVNLSGGEKQRISIARLMLKNPSIILLDEATSALDKETEMQIQTMLRDLCKNRTTLVVTHRLASIIDAHQIIVLNNGQIYETGTHQELLHRGGLYSKTFLQQQKEVQSQDESVPKFN